MGKSTISMAMFNSFLYVHQRKNGNFRPFFQTRCRFQTHGAKRALVAAPPIFSEEAILDLQQVHPQGIRKGICKGICKVY